MSRPAGRRRIRQSATCKSDAGRCDCAAPWSRCRTAGRPCRRPPRALIWPWRWPSNCLPGGLLRDGLRRPTGWALRAPGGKGVSKPMAPVTSCCSGIQAHADALRSRGNVDRAGIPEARVIVNERIVGRAHEGVDVHVPAVGIQCIAFDLADLHATIVDRRAGADGAQLIFGQREGAARARPAAAAAGPPDPRIRAADRLRRDTSRCRRPTPGY